MSKFNNILPILFISFLLVTRQCLGASLKQSSTSHSTSAVLNIALPVYQSILEQRILIAFRKYVSTEVIIIRTIMFGLVFQI